MPVFITIVQFNLLLDSWFMCQGQRNFHELFLPVFLGWLSENGYEIVSYTIPHFNTNMSMAIFLLLR